MISSLKGYTGWLKGAEVGNSVCFITASPSTVTYASLRRNAKRINLKVEIKRVFVTIPDEKKPESFPALVVTVKERVKPDE